MTTRKRRTLWTRRKGTTKVMHGTVKWNTWRVGGKNDANV